MVTPLVRTSPCVIGICSYVGSAITFEPAFFRTASESLACLYGVPAKEAKSTYGQRLDVFSYPALRRVLTFCFFQCDGQTPACRNCVRANRGLDLTIPFMVKLLMAVLQFASVKTLLPNVGIPVGTSSSLSSTTHPSRTMWLYWSKHCGRINLIWILMHYRMALLLRTVVLDLKMIPSWTGTIAMPCSYQITNHPDHLGHPKTPLRLCLKGRRRVRKKCRAQRLIL